MNPINIICANCGIDALVEPEVADNDEAICYSCKNPLHEEKEPPKPLRLRHVAVGLPMVARTGCKIAIVEISDAYRDLVLVSWGNPTQFKYMTIWDMRTPVDEEKDSDGCPIPDDEMTKLRFWKKWQPSDHPALEPSPETKAEFFSDLDKLEDTLIRNYNALEDWEKETF